MEGQTLTTAVNGLTVDTEKSTLPIQPVGDRVYIDPFPPDEYLSEEAKIARPVGFKDPFMRGRIMAIGGGEYGNRIPDCIKLGLVVEYWHQQAIDYAINKKVYHMVRASDVFNIV